MTPAITPPAARALEMAAAAADACPALVVTPTSASERGGGVGDPAAAGIATRRNALQIVELRKEVVSLQFLGDRDERGDADGGDQRRRRPSLRSGSRRAAAMIRGPKQGLAAAVAVGTEAFIAAAGRDAHVARHDLATGRELGVSSRRSTTASRGEDPAHVYPGRGRDGPGRSSSPRARGRRLPVGRPRRAEGVESAASLVAAAAAPRGDDDARPRRLAGAAPSPSATRSAAALAASPKTRPRPSRCVASNGEPGPRTFARRRRRAAGARPAEGGQRWVACAHAGRRDDVLTLSAQGDLATWRPMGSGGSGGSAGSSCRIAGPVLREVASASVAPGAARETAVGVRADGRPGRRRRRGADDGGDRRRVRGVRRFHR